jgi:hypothetical protein
MSTAQTAAAIHMPAIAPVERPLGGDGVGVIEAVGAAVGRVIVLEGWADEILELMLADLAVLAELIALVVNNMRSVC